MFKPIRIIWAASFKQQSKHKSVLIAHLMLPISYTIVFTLQILIAYHVNPNAFLNLPLPLFLSTFYGLQMVVFIASDRSLRYIAHAIRTSELDILLLKPINLFYFKYFRILELSGPFMITLYAFGLIITAIWAKISLLIFLKMVMFIVCASLIKLNIRAGLRGMMFFTPDALNSTRLEESVEIMGINKPREVFPLALQFILTFVYPLMLYHNYLFDIVRFFEQWWVWPVIFSWVMISIIFNKMVWYIGLRKYESIG